MKLKSALEIGQDCGLDTVEEAIFNIQLHAMSIFNYGEEKQEWNELIQDYKDSGFNKNDKINYCLDIINGEIIRCHRLSDKESMVMSINDTYIDDKEIDRVIKPFVKENW